MWNRAPGLVHDTCVSLNKTLRFYCIILWLDNKKRSCVVGFLSKNNPVFWACQITCWWPNILIDPKFWLIGRESNNFLREALACVFLFTWYWLVIFIFNQQIFQCDFFRPANPEAVLIAMATNTGIFYSCIKKKKKESSILQRSTFANIIQKSYFYILYIHICFIPDPNNVFILFLLVP